MAICHQCKYFVKGSGSCGPLGLGKKVQYKGQKYKLCGCVMEVKTRLATSGCPIGMWGRDVPAATYDRAKEFIEANRGKARLPRPAADELIQLSNEILKTNRGKTGCGPCLKQIMDEMDRAIKNGY